MLHGTTQRVTHGTQLLTLAALLACPAVPAAAQSGREQPVVAPKRSPASPRKPVARASSGRRTRARALPALHHTTPRGPWALSADLAGLLDARVKSGTWGVMVVSLTRGDTLFSRNGDALLRPASTMKLFTTALALDRLGPGHQFSTEVLRTGPLATDGTINGDIVLRGGGDPAFSNRFIPGDQSAPMRALARQVGAAGVKRVRGALVADASAFEPKRIPDGWLARYRDASYAQRVSALSLNENLLHVVIANSGGKAIAQFEPKTTAYRLLNNVRVVAGSRRSKLVVAKQPDGSVVARGWIGALSGPRVYVVVVEDPAMFAAGSFRQALADEGIEVDGETRAGAAPAGAAAITSIASPYLSELVTTMNGESNNHFAELIFRDAARTVDPNGIGSAMGANALLQQTLATHAAVPMGVVQAFDGSGLSTLNRVTPRAMTQLLAWAHRTPWARDFHLSLPVAGYTETLRSRMRSTPAQGNLHAKTGTTNDVITLGGYVTSRDGEVLAFSFLYNGKERWRAREAIDAMGATLASFAR